MSKGIKVVTEKPIVCPYCGSGNTNRHGFNVTKQGKFPRRKCQECGRTFYEDKEVSE